MTKPKKRKHCDAETGVDMVLPSVQAQVVSVGDATKSEWAPGTVGALREMCQRYCVSHGLTFVLDNTRAIPVSILKMPLRDLGEGDSWKLGSFGGGVAVYAQKDSGLFTTESEQKATVELMCQFIVMNLREPAKGESKILTLHFATQKTDKIVEEWCQKNNVVLKRIYQLPDKKEKSQPENPDQNSDKSKTPTDNPPSPPSVSVKLPR